jgi:hypothetical protein
MRIEGGGGAPASQGSFAEHQSQHSLLCVIPGAELLAGNARAWSILVGRVGFHKLCAHNMVIFLILSSLVG